MQEANTTTKWREPWRPWCFSSIGEIGFVSDRLTTVSYLIRRGDDVHADNLFSQDGLRVDAVESSSKLCVLGKSLENKTCGSFSQFHPKLNANI